MPLAFVLLASAVPAPQPPGDPLPPYLVARYGSLHYRTPGPIRGSALSPDGKLLAVSGVRGVRLYEVPAWRVARELRTPAGFPSPVTCRPLAFSPDGKYLAYRRDPDAVVVWDLSADRPGREIKAAARDQWTPLLQFLPGNVLALADADGLHFHHPDTGAEVASVPAANVSHLSPDGKVFARSSRPKGVRPDKNPGELVLGDARTGRDVARTGRIPPHDDRLAFAPDGKTFAFRNGNGLFELRDALAGAVLAYPELPDGGYESRLRSYGWWGVGGPGVGFTADGAVFVAQPSGVWRWDPATGTELPRLATGDGPAPGAPHALPGGKTLLTPTAGGWVRVWAADGTEMPIPDRYLGSVAVTPSPDGRLVAVADEGGRVDLRDAATGRVARTIRRTGKSLPRLAFSPDGARLAVEEGDRDAEDPNERPGAPGGPFPFKLYRVADGAALGGGRGGPGGRARVHPGRAGPPGGPGGGVHRLGPGRPGRGVGPADL